MIQPATYEALSPVLLTMLRIEGGARGIRIRHLLTLYPERLEGGLKPYIELYAGFLPQVEEYMSRHEAELKAFSSRVSNSEQLRANLGAALSVALLAIAGKPEHRDYLVTLNILNEKHAYTRLLLMLALLCSRLPQLEENSFEMNDELNVLLRDAAPYLGDLFAIRASA